MKTATQEARTGRAIEALMQVAFAAAFATLAAGLVLWLTLPSSGAGAACLNAGLLGLLAMPVLKLVWALVVAVGQRDWLLFGSTLVVLAILFALTLRDAAAH